MTYEPGVLVRRQQREYPPELRKEIALAALEVGNNREVARLYSERLGYTVNESTVRGIKKRYLEGVQKGKIESATTGVSPRSVEDKDSEGEESVNFQPEQVMKLQLEVLEGNKMKDNQAIIEMDDTELDTESGEGDMNGGSTLVISESALSINGDDSVDSCNQLSIDTGPEPEPSRPSIRVAQGLTKEPHLGILAAHLTGTAGVKRKQNSTSVLAGNGLSLPLKKQRPNSQDNEMEILSLEKDIKALQWLARRKEQEWDQIIRLLKQKEEKMLRAQRAKVMIQVEADHLVSKYRASPTTVLLPSPLQPVIVPQQQVLILPASQSAPTSNTTTTTRHIQPKPSGASLLAQARTTVNKMTSNSASNGTVEQETKFSSVMDKASKNLQRSAVSPTVERENGKKEEVKKNTPMCQGCSQKKSEFVCAGCSNRWYCSRECQVEDWDEHADECSG